MLAPVLSPDDRDEMVLGEVLRAFAEDAVSVSAYDVLIAMGLPRTAYGSIRASLRRLELGGHLSSEVAPYGPSASLRRYYGPPRAI